jgi:MFS family permease
VDDPRTTGPTWRAPILALLGANAVSETRNVLAFVAIPWFVLQTADSAAGTGLTGGAFLLATVVSGAVGGPVVDRIGFKRVSVAADLAGAVTVALIPLLYQTIGLAFWQLLARLRRVGPGLAAEARRPWLDGRSSSMMRGNRTDGIIRFAETASGEGERDEHLSDQNPVGHGRL